MKKKSLVNTERHKKTIEVKYEINYYNFGKTGFYGVFSSIQIADNSNNCTSTMHTHEENQVVWKYFSRLSPSLNCILLYVARASFSFQAEHVSAKETGDFTWKLQLLTFVIGLYVYITTFKRFRFNVLSFIFYILLFTSRWFYSRNSIHR